MTGYVIKKIFNGNSSDLSLQQENVKHRYYKVIGFTEKFCSGIVDNGCKIERNKLSAGC